jgi:hypothetical protein
LKFTFFFLQSVIFSYMNILLPSLTAFCIKLSLTWSNVISKFNQWHIEKRVIVISIFKRKTLPSTNTKTLIESLAVNKQDRNIFSWLPSCYFTMHKNVIFTKVTVLQTKKFHWLFPSNSFIHLPCWKHRQLEN